MKKILFAFFAVLALAACSKDEIGGTATQSMAGEWYVTVEAVDDEGNTVFTDDELFGIGKFQILTYNTNANVADKMIVDDEDNFWKFRAVATCNQSSLSFATDGEVTSIDNAELGVTITDGKILPKAGKQNNGSAADSIVFYVNFNDDPYPATYGYAKYKVSGVRYSGLVEND